VTAAALRRLRDAVEAGTISLDDYARACGELETPTPKNPAAVALGRLGGSKRSPAQVRAARRNGRLGGRPTLSDTLYKVGTAVRVNLSEPGVLSLLRKKLVEKDWNRNDAGGEAVRLTASGRTRFLAENC
jgi:hypothetical protein